LASHAYPLKVLLCVGAKRLHDVLGSAPDVHDLRGSSPTLSRFALVNLARTLSQPLGCAIMQSEPSVAEHFAVLKWRLLTYVRSWSGWSLQLQA